METYQHLVWSAKTHESWRASKGAPKVFEKEITGKIEVWIGQTSIFYRVDMPIISETDELFLQRQEFELRSGYAISQDYNCRAKGSRDKWEVCNVQIIPTFSDARTSDVNLLQYPHTELLTRLLLLSKIPDQWNELKFSKGPDKFELSTWDESKQASRQQSQPGDWTKYSGSFTNHELASILVSNGFDSKPLRNFGGMQFRGNQLVKFTRSDETVQSKTLLLPRLIIDFELEASDSHAPDIKFKDGATVFDFRACKPVPLNQFPDKNCPPKSYKWTGQPKDISELSGQVDARFNLPPPPPSNQISPIFAGVLGFSLLALIFMFWKFKTRV